MHSAAEESGTNQASPRDTGLTLPSENMAKASEQRIRRGQDVDAVDDGLELMAALAKVATDLGLPRGHISIRAKI
jgi:hypothetical protein